jgi:hypothetical protein
MVTIAARRDPYVIDDDGLWRLIIDLDEIVLHRRGYVIVRRQVVQGGEQ